MSKFKYALVTSCDVEGSFSMFENMLSDKDNLEKLVVVHCLRKNKNVTERRTEF